MTISDDPHASDVEARFAATVARYGIQAVLAAQAAINTTIATAIRNLDRWPAEHRTTAYFVRYVQREARALSQDPNNDASSVPGFREATENLLEAFDVLLEYS